jgi:hypothetical protein
MSSRIDLPIAVLAAAVVAVAAAGSATAVTSHRGDGDALIATHSLSGNRLRNNTVTGTQIKESTLGTVPSAKTAAAVGGFSVERVFFAAPQNAVSRQIFSADGLVLKAGCDGADPTLTATTAPGELHIAGNGYAATYDLDYSTAETAVNVLAGYSEGSVTVRYASVSGHIITMDLAFDDAPTFQGRLDCTVFGSALVD